MPLPMLSSPLPGLGRLGALARPLTWLLAALPGWAESDPAAAGFLADMARESGHDCFDPESVEREWARDPDGAKVLRLRCGEGSYRGRIPKDGAPEVEPSLDD